MTAIPRKIKHLGKNMVLLIDTNIVLDVLMNRQPHYEYSRLIWKMCLRKQADGYISALTFANADFEARSNADLNILVDSFFLPLSFVLEYDITLFRNIAACIA